MQSNGWQPAAKSCVLLLSTQRCEIGQRCSGGTASGPADCLTTVMCCSVPPQTGERARQLGQQGVSAAPNCSGGHPLRAGRQGATGGQGLPGAGRCELQSRRGAASCLIPGGGRRPAGPLRSSLGCGTLTTLISHAVPCSQGFRRLLRSCLHSHSVLTWHQHSWQWKAPGGHAL